MRIISLTAVNAYSFKRMDLSEAHFNKDGITLIHGNNLDQDSSNGAGKSTITKVIYYSLFGEELNGESVDEISNRYQDNGHFVQISLADLGRVFTIQKMKEFKPSPEEAVEFKLPGGSRKHTGSRLFVDDLEIKGDTERAIRQIIQDKIGISKRLFLTSVLTAQNSQVDFVSSNDKSEVLSELLDLEKFSAPLEGIKKELREIDQNIELSESKVEMLTRQKETVQSQENELKKRQDLWDAERVSRLERLNERIDELKKETLELPTKSKIDISGLEYESAQLICEKERLEADLNKKSANCDSSSVRLLDLRTNLNKLEVARAEVVAKHELILRHLKEIGVDELRRSVELLKTKKFDYSSLDEALKNRSDLEAKRISCERKIAALIGKKEMTASHASLQRELLLKRECPTCNRSWGAEHASHREAQIFDIDQRLKNVLGMIDEEIEEATRLRDSISKESTGASEAIVHYTELGATERKVLGASGLENELRELTSYAKTEVGPKIKELEDSIEKELRHLKDAESERDRLCDGIRMKILDVDRLRMEVSEKISQAKLHNMEVDHLLYKREQLSSRMNELRSEVGQVKDEQNPFNESLNTVKIQMQEIGERILETTAKIDTLEEESTYLQFWKTGFGSAGIRSFIIDSVLSELTTKTNDNLMEIFDGSISVIFSSETTNSKGITQNKIDTKFYLNGKESPLLLLSGGEQRRLKLAVDLAISEVAESRARVRFPIKFLDEPFDGIDGDGQVKCVSLLKRIGKSKAGLFIISHDDRFQSLCQNVIKVIKKDGESKILGS